MSTNELPPEDELSLGIDLDRKPELVLGDPFPGARLLRAAVSPDCSYQLLEETIQMARSELLIYIYNLSATYILTLIEKARDRGVAVSIMYDAKDTKGGEVAKINALGVDVKVAPSRDPRRVFDVCHQKFIVVDGKSVYLGSANFATSSIPMRLAGKKRKKGNREWMIRIDEPEIARWYKKLFKADYDIPEFESFAVAFDVEARENLILPEPPFDPPLDIEIGDFPDFQGKIIPLVSPDNYYTVVKRMIDHAGSRIWLQQQYIKGGANAPSVDKLLDAIARRKEANPDLDLRIIVSSAFASGWTDTKATLEAHGLIEHLQAVNLDNFIHCHNKGLIVDDDEVVISSTNWSENSIRRAREAGVAVRSADLTSYFSAVFEDDWNDGWTIAQGDAGPSFDIVAGEEPEMIAIHPADEE